MNDSEKKDAVKIPKFDTASNTSGKGFIEERRIFIPRHRVTPLKNLFVELIKPLVEHMKLQVKYDEKKKSLHLRPGPSADVSALQKGVDYINAFVLGFEQRV
jgi:RNA-binding protein PNO1